MIDNWRVNAILRSKDFFKIPDYQVLPSWFVYTFCLVLFPIRTIKYHLFAEHDLRYDIVSHSIWFKKKRIPLSVLEDLVFNKLDEDGQYHYERKFELPACRWKENNKGENK